MQIPKSLTLVLFQSLAGSSLTTASSCGPDTPCPLTETCTTITRTSMIATCAPTPTCLWVYQGCNWGPGELTCCSGYCAATKCRATDPKWPNCVEDMGPCDADENCCYNNKCVDGFCRKG